MDEIDRILTEVIGPGLDRDWTAEARTIASRMHEAHGLPRLDEAAIEELANGLDGIELAGRPNLQVKPIDKTAEHAALEAVRKHVDALQRLLDPDTPFGRRFLEAAERTVNERETARASVSRVRFPRSPVAGLPGRLAFASLVAAVEAESMKNTPQRRRGASWRADVIGQHLPDLYSRIYPAAPIGTFREGDGLEPGLLDGPRHRFVQMAAEVLGFSDTGVAAVSRAAQRRRPRSDK